VIGNYQLPVTNIVLKGIIQFLKYAGAYAEECKSISNAVKVRKPVLCDVPFLLFL